MNAAPPREVPCPVRLRFAVLLVAWVGASGCSDGPGADPDAGAVDSGVDGGVEVGVDGGVDASIDVAPTDASMADAGDLGAEADSGSADLGSDASSDQGVDVGALGSGARRVRPGEWGTLSGAAPLHDRE
jgi:hypothetical protein